MNDEFHPVGEGEVSPAVPCAVKPPPGRGAVRRQAIAWALLAVIVLAWVALPLLLGDPHVGSVPVWRGRQWVHRAEAGHGGLPGYGGYGRPDPEAVAKKLFFLAGPSGVPGLMRAMDDKSRTVRAAAFYALLYWSDERIAEQLVRKMLRVEQGSDEMFDLSSMASHWLYEQEEREHFGRYADEPPEPDHPPTCPHLVLPILAGRTDAEELRWSLDGFFRRPCSNEAVHEIVLRVLTDEAGGDGRPAERARRCLDFIEGMGKFRGR